MINILSLSNSFCKHKKYKGYKKICGKDYELNIFTYVKNIKNEKSKGYKKQ